MIVALSQGVVDVRFVVRIRNAIGPWQRLSARGFAGEKEEQGVQNPVLTAGAPFLAYEPASRRIRTPLRRSAGLAASKAIGVRRRILRPEAWNERAAGHVPRGTAAVS